MYPSGQGDASVVQPSSCDIQQPNDNNIISFDDDAEENSEREQESQGSYIYHYTKVIYVCVRTSGR